MLYVDINGHFDDSEGLVGSPQQEGLFSRDGTMDLSGHWNTYGKEWQVKNTEPKLFRVNCAPQHPEGCVYESNEMVTNLRRRLTDDHGGKYRGCDRGLCQVPWPTEGVLRL
jgi:hypothetical protein